MKVHTLICKKSINGIGLHTGALCEIQFIPSEKKGIRFWKNDICIPVSPKFVIETRRGVVLGKDGGEIQTVEHLLAAIRWLGISSLEIQVNGDEIPILDGSSAGWIKLLEPYRKETHEEFDELPLKQPILIQEKDAYIKAAPSPSFSIQYTIDFPSPIGTQTWKGKISSDLFKSDIAPARTFGFAEELESLREKGLAVGGNLENCVVIKRGLMITPLRFKNEPVRHKVLDLLGDLSLLSWIPVGKFEVFKGGHFLHTLMSKALADQAL
ncbi:MAG: UDP-3-O-acyl-N-acetylglucosamine deacetylase [Firmicutes bacterium]|nr:UDP-3-O-acyl-N-acetylglucosamine deacetylase [Bacillota bacterium]